MFCRKKKSKKLFLNIGHCCWVHLDFGEGRINIYLLINIIIIKKKKLFNLLPNLLRSMLLTHVISLFFCMLLIFLVYI